MRPSWIVASVCLLAAPRLVAAPPVEEAAVFGYLQRGRFHELKNVIDALPETSPSRSLLGLPARRLVEIKDRLIAAVNAGKAAVDFRDVHPAAFEGGRIVAATPLKLKIRHGEKERDVYWNGLPLSVTFEMVRRFLTQDADQDAAVLKDLGEAAGIVGEAGTPERDRVETTLGVLRTLHNLATQSQLRWAADRATWSFAWCRDRLAGLSPAEGESAWLMLARRWVDRLEKAEADRVARWGEVARRLPAGAVIHVWDDFEEGPELVPPGWWRGVSCVPPDGASPANRWCRRTVLGEKNVLSGEMFEDYAALQSPDGKRIPICVFGEGLRLSVRVRGANVNQFSLILSADGHENHVNFSVLEVPLPRMNEWCRIKIRLDDLSLHRPCQWSEAPLFALGAPLLRLAFVANRADPAVDDGDLYLDNVCLYTAPADDNGEETR